jgi:hypothetical protein
MALMSSIIDVDPSSFEEEIDQAGLEGCHGGGVHLYHEE